MLGSGEAPEHVAFGGAGDPLRELGIATVMRRIRTLAHLGSIVFTDGALLQDREVRRDASEAEVVVAWVPPLARVGEPPRSPAAIARENAFDRHVEGIAALRRETQVRVVVELEVRPGENDLPESVAAWRRAIETIRPHRVMVIPPGPFPPPETLAAIDRVREPLGRIAGASLLDPIAADRRCWCAGSELRWEVEDELDEVAEGAVEGALVEGEGGAEDAASAEDDVEDRAEDVAGAEDATEDRAEA